MDDPTKPIVVQDDESAQTQALEQTQTKTQQVQTQAQVQVQPRVEAAATAPSLPTWTLACSKKELDRRKLMKIMIDKRAILVSFCKEQYYALDNLCYHEGGPLDRGKLVDIEDIPKRPCVVCPWHEYIFALDTGEALYKEIDGTKPYKFTIRSRGQKQRTHPIKVEDGQVFVQLTKPKKKLELDSDYFTSDKYILRQSQKQQSSCLSCTT